MRETSLARRRSAAEIGKGEIPVRCISEADVARLLDPPALLDALAEASFALALGKVAAPPRPQVEVPGAGFSLAMAAWTPGMSITVKVVNVFENNLALGLPNHLALINLFDPGTACRSASWTAPTSPASERPPRRRSRCAALARPGARTATIVGAGVQAREHLRLLPLVRPFTEIKIASLHPEDAERLAAASRSRGRSATSRRHPGADVVCLCTHSYDPVIETAWVSPGTHVTSVGYAPPRGELPRICRGVTPSTSRRRRPSRRRRSVAPSWPISPRARDHARDMLLGRKPGRISETQITLYKGMGIAMEDMVAAHLVWERRAHRTRDGRRHLSGGIGGQTAPAAGT